MCYIFRQLSVVQHCLLHISSVISSPTLCVTGFHCYQRFSIFLLQVVIAISGPTLSVTYSHCYQRSNTVCYIFPLLSAVQHRVLQVFTVISGSTLCVTYFHCYQRSNTVCYRFPLLSVVQHSPSLRRQVRLHRKHRHFALDHLAVPGRGHCGHPVAIQR